MAGSNVVGLFDERWVNDVFVGGNLWMSISSKGRVRFVTGDGKPAVLSLKQVLEMGKVLSVAFGAEENELEERLANVERDPAQ
jgi:hypothetical protein